MDKDNDTLTASEWWRPGAGMMYRRSALPDSHPQSWPSLWEAKFGEPMPNKKRVEVGLPPKPEEPIFTLKDILQVLRNVGWSTECGACLSIALTGSNIHDHTCGRLNEASITLGVALVPGEMKLLQDKNWLYENGADEENDYGD